MKIVGLTGGIASGKSTVSRIFIKLGIPVVDADLLSKQAFATPECLEQVQLRFGTVDRRELRKIVFADEDALADLEIIMHPPIHKLRDEAFAELLAKGHPICIYDSPLLIESGETKNMHKVIVVECPVSLRKERLMKRDSITAELAQSMIDAQVSDTERRENADYLLENVGCQTTLEAGVDLILKYIRDPDYQASELDRIKQERQSKIGKAHGRVLSAGEAAKVRKELGF